MNKEEKKERNLKIFLIIVVLLILLILLILFITDYTKPIIDNRYGYLTPKKGKSVKVKKILWPFNTKTGKFLGS